MHVDFAPAMGTYLPKSMSSGIFVCAKSQITPKAVILLARTQIHKHAKDGFSSVQRFSPLQPSFVYLFCPKTDFVGEYTDTHYKMTRFLFLHL
jgi:hypothetical protein